MKRLVLILAIVFILFTVKGYGYDVPPTFALMNLTVNMLNPVGFWDEAFSPSPSFSFTLQYPARVLNLYLGGRIDFCSLNGENFKDVYLQIFSLNAIASYNYLEYNNFQFYAGGGLGVYFEELEFGDGSEDAVLGGIKVLTGLRSRISTNMLMNAEIGYTYIADSPYITFGVGLAYSFSSFSSSGE